MLRGAEFEDEGYMFDLFSVLSQGMHALFPISTLVLPAQTPLILALALATTATVTTLALAFTLTRIAVPLSITSLCPLRNPH
jgi:hypothetical protein